MSKTPQPAADEECILYFDGGARGNGKANPVCGAGFVIKTPAGVAVVSGQKYLPDLRTNNEAEYAALEEGLREAGRRGYKKVRVRGDSMLVISQMNGTWKIKAPNIAKHHAAVKAIADKIGKGGTGRSVVFEHVRRELNADADRRANRAMDTKRSEIEDHAASSGITKK